MLEIILAGFAAFFSYFLIPDLLYDRPYDLSAVQVIIIAIIAISGISIVAERKLLFTFFRRKKLRKQEGKNHPEKKNKGQQYH